MLEDTEKTYRDDALLFDQTYEILNKLGKIILSTNAIEVPKMISAYANLLDIYCCATDDGF